MLHPRGNEGHGRVASRAVVIRRDVIRTFTCGPDVVVTTGAGSFRRGVVHAVEGCEVVNCVAEVATVGGEDVGGRLGSGTDPPPDHVASIACARCALEYALHVTVFARQIPMRAAQLETRCEMVEAGALHRGGRCDSQQNHHPEKNEDRRSPGV